MHFSLEKCNAAEVLDVVANHQFALANGGAMGIGGGAEQNVRRRHKRLSELDVERLRWKTMVEVPTGL